MAAAYSFAERKKTVPAPTGRPAISEENGRYEGSTWEQVAQMLRGSHNYWVYVIFPGADRILKGTELHGCKALGLK